MGKKISTATGRDGVNEVRFMRVISLTLKIIRGGIPLIDKRVKEIVRACRG